MLLGVAASAGGGGHLGNVGLLVAHSHSMAILFLLYFPVVVETGDSILVRMVSDTTKVSCK